MTKREAIKEFNRTVRPFLPKNDKPAIRQAISFYIDMLHRNGRITNKQANSWDWD